MQYVQSLFDKPIYLVGGAVRDLALDLQPKDYDFSSVLTTEEVREQIKGKHKVYAMGEKHGTLMFVYQGNKIELTTFRTEIYTTGSRQPKVEFVIDLIKDLGRRDSTMNAIAISCTDFSITDPFKGLDDIKNKIVRSVMPSKIMIKDDPLRILRVIRQSLRYGFKIDPLLRKRLKSMSSYLLTLSKERLMDELDNILSLVHDDPLYLTILWELDVFKFIIPELHLQYKYDQNSPYHDHELHIHTSLVTFATPNDDLTLRWAALLHDVGKPFVWTKNKRGYYNYIMHDILGADIAKKTAIHLKWSSKRKDAVVKLVGRHLEDDSVLKIYDNANKKEKNDEKETT